MISHVICLLYLAQFSRGSEPYPYPARHGSPRSHRQVRECHDVSGRNELYEVVTQNPGSGSDLLDVKMFTDDIKDSQPKRFAYGHLATIANPLSTLSVYEPGPPNSCTINTTQRKVSESAALHNCIYATNGGFFNTTTGNCLGNMISDRRLLVDGHGLMNPNFGLLDNGSIVVGYLTEQHVKGLGFVNLIQGIIWLVRNGENYVDESMNNECDDMQTTGDMQGFVDVVSARTAIGHDSHGNVLLLHVEGKTWARGINLREFADLLIDHGFVNAVNLDGGGSSSVVYNNTLINYPSDHCSDDPAYRCEKAISAFLCVHGACSPSSCIHGSCALHKCVCRAGYAGAACDTPLQCPGNCSYHGTCSDEGCDCDAGWVGSSCHVQCPDSYYGYDCTKTCVCQHGSCDHVHGECSCYAGWTGSSCNTGCPNNTWGQDCNNTCVDCSEHGACDHVTGECMCSIGWQGRICQVYRGTTHFINGLNTREFGILAVLIGLVAIALISISVNVYYCLMAKSKHNSGYNRSTRSTTRGLSSNRSPRLPAAEISALEHTQRQIPIYREIQQMTNRKPSNTFSVDIGEDGKKRGREGGRERSREGSREYTKQSKDVLEMIEKEAMKEEEEDSFSEIDDTSLLLK